MAEKTVEEGDRISELPLELKQHILFYLRLRDVLITSSLSHNWRYTWLTLPFLDLGYSSFSDYSKYFDAVNATHPFKQHLYKHLSLINNEEDVYKEWELKNIGYVLWIDQILKLYTNKSELTLNGSIKKFDIFVPRLLPKRLNLRACAFDVITQLLSFAEFNNVEELSYHIISYNLPWFGINKNEARAHARDSFYCLPNLSSLLVSNSLTRLTLVGCNLTINKALTNEVVGDEPISISLPCLKQLHLSMGTVEEKFLEKLLSKCVSLEKLECLSCIGVKELRVPGLPNLKIIKVMSSYEPRRVHLDTSLDLQYLSLEKLSFLRNKHKCKINVAPNSWKHLVKLSIDSFDIVDDFINNVVGFTQLKTLWLINCPKLKHIKIPSNRLTEVCIEKCPNLCRLELDTHKLLSFSYTITSIKKAMPLLLKCPVPPFCTYFSLEADFKTIPCHTKLVALLANFSQSTTVRISIDSKQHVNNLIIPQELRESLCPPLLGVQHLFLFVPTPLTNQAILQNLDNLLWLSPYTKTISLADQSLSKLSLELIYEDEKCYCESCGCYPSKQINCWRHSLKDIKILNQKGLGDVNSMRNLLDNALRDTKAAGLA